MSTKKAVIARNEAISELCRSGCRGYFSICLPHVLLLSVCLILSLNSFSQKKDTIKAATMYDLLLQIKKQPGTSDPLIMLNDSVYKGNIGLVKSSDIESVDVMKGEDAKIIYGPDASHGVFIMKTKNYMSGEKSQPKDIISLQLKDNIAYVVDGIPVSAEQVNTNDILIQQSISGKKLEESGFYPEKRLDSVIVIITKTAARKAYQHKLEAFSQEYKKYVDENHGDDYTCSYFLDGKILDKEEEGFLFKLYNIPAEKIESVAVQSARPVDSFIGLNIRITTKK